MSQAQPTSLTRAAETRLRCPRPRREAGQSRHPPADPSHWFVCPAHLDHHSLRRRLNRSGHRARSDQPGILGRDPPDQTQAGATCAACRRRFGQRGIKPERQDRQCVCPQFEALGHRTHSPPSPPSSTSGRDLPGTYERQRPTESTRRTRVWLWQRPTHSGAGRRPRLAQAATVRMNFWSTPMKFPSRTAPRLRHRGPDSYVQCIAQMAPPPGREPSAEFDRLTPVGAGDPRSRGESSGTKSCVS